MLFGFLFFFLFLLLDNLEFVLDSLHALPLELVVNQEEVFFEESEDMDVFNGVEVLLLGFVVKDLGYLFSERSKILLVLEDLIAGF